MATIIDGKALAAELKAEIRDAAAKLPRQPGLAVVLLGDDPASRKYMAGKERDCRECGFRSMEHRLPADTSEAALLDLYDRQLAAFGENASLAHWTGCWNSSNIMTANSAGCTILL